MFNLLCSPRRVRLLCSALVVSFAACSTSARDLAHDFRTPPASAGPWVYWIWINGNVTQEGIRADLEDMRRVGIRGAMLFEGSLYLPPGPMRYGSDAWHANVQFAIRTAAEVGVEIALMNCAGWATSGGPWNPVENSMKLLVWSELTIDGGARWQGTVPQPTEQLGFYRDAALLALPLRGRDVLVTALPEKTGLKSSPAFSSPAEWDASVAGEFSADEVIDLSDKIGPDGEIDWDAPPGRWRLMRFGFTSAARKNHPAPPEGTGLEVDKFDRAAVANHFEQSLGRIIREAGPLVGQSLTGVLIDSWEAGPQTWTNALPQEFARRRGYALTRYLPALAGRVVGTRAETEAFLADYRRTLGELYAENYYAVMQSLAHAHGMKLFAEPYGGVLDEPRAFAHVDVPMIEFWNHGLYKALDFTPAAAHLAGNPLVLAEAFTSRPPVSGWMEHPSMLKPLGDAAFAAGVTGFVLHSYVHQPRSDLAPGFTHGRYGTQFGRLNSWWPLAPDWIDYVRRCQLLLQHGRAVVDLAQLHEDRLKSEYREIPATDAPAGFQVDHLSVAQLGELTVEDGALVSAGGARYRVLRLPPQWTASAETLRHLARLHAAGAQLVGPAPFAPASLPDATSARGVWENLVGQIWDSSAPPASSLEAALSALGATPDFRVLRAPEGADVRFAHRTAAEGDFYFLTNQSGRAIEAEVDFRIADRAPELWDPLTGRVAGAPAFAVRQGRTALTLALAAGEALFVVFRHPRPAVWPECVLRADAAVPISAPAQLTADGRLVATEAGEYRVQFSDGTSDRVAVPALPAPLALSGPWQVSFAAPRHAPASRVFAQLRALSDHAEAEVKYFSGVASYETTFDLAAPQLTRGGRVLLELGEVHDLARVTLNGHTFATRWHAPFMLDVTDAVRTGANSLRVEVANRWVNRLIGDEQLPADAAYGNRGLTNGALLEFPAWWHDATAVAQRERAAFSTWQFYRATSPLLPSGLVGPVRLRFATTLDLTRQ